MVMILNTCLSSAWWCTPVIPVGKLRQEDQVFQVSLDCLGSKKREEEKKAERERETDRGNYLKSVTSASRLKAEKEEQM
jgi:hypothetical protein